MEKTTRSMLRRLYALVFLGMLAVMAYVSYVMYGVAVRESGKYQALANDQQFKTMTVAANRGSIYDANGQVLAQSITVYTVFVDPKTFQNEVATQLADVEDGKKSAADMINYEYEIISSLTQNLDVTEEEVREKLYKDNRYQVVAKDVEKTAAVAISERMSDLGIISVGVTPTAKRYYPHNDLASSVIGHLHYDGYGILGLESYYDDYLTGVDGKIITAIDASGREIQYRYKQSYDAQDGDSIYTNLDTTIQYYTEKALKSAVELNSPKNRACAIVMEAKTGKILAMATEPDYDLNAPAEIYDQSTAELLAGILATGDEESYNAQRSDAWNRQWRNKAISELYYPGSVFKVVTGSAALEEQAISLTDKFYCKGYVTVVKGVPPVHCWTTNGGHGEQNFVQAMTNSCNPAFIAIGQALGAEKFTDYFKAFGLTEKTGIDLPAEADSIYVPYSRMTLMDLSVSAFGQTNKITPIQMITAYAAVVNGGYLVTPYIVNKIVDSDGNIVKEFTPTIKRQVISEETSEIMRETLETVVTTNQGSNVYIKGYEIGGKSGTSQKLDEKDGEHKYVSSYCAFYPAEDPEIIMLVMVDEPTNGRYYGSAVAAPVVSEVFEEILPYLGYYAEYTEEELEDLDVNVPSVLNAETGSAQATLEGLGLNVKIIGDGETVVRQVPSTGSAMPKGCTVVLYTEEGTEPKYVKVPDLTGRSLSYANEKLTNLGLNLKPLGGAARKAGATCSGVMNYKEETVEVGTIIEAYFIVNDETG